MCNTCRYYKCNLSRSLMVNILSNISVCEKIILISFLLTGILFIGSSIPLLLNKIPPNDWYGFRTPKTQSNEEIWYKSNRYMARDFLILGIIHLAFTISYFIYSLFNILTDHTNSMIFAIGGTSILSLGTLVMIIRSFLYLRKL